MPNWKKVITSGSNAQLNQITASGFNLVGTGTAELEVDGHITSSGNISASGDITCDDITADDITADSIIANADEDVVINVTAAGISFEANAGDTFGYNSNQNNVDFQFSGENDQNLFYIDSSTNRVGIGTNSPSSKLQVDGDITSTHITASGNISSSNQIISKFLILPTSDGGSIAGGGLSFGTPGNDHGHIYDDGTILALGYNDYDAIKIHDTGTILEVEGSTIIDGNLKTTSHITASGNISASSGIITAHEIIAGAGTFSANIQANGNIVGDDATDIQAINDITAGGVLDLQGNTDATDASGDTGILRVEGGASIAKKVFVGTDLNVSNNISASGATHRFGGKIEIDDKVMTDKIQELNTGAGITLSHPITASGNISSSGQILASAYRVQGNILSAMSSDTIALGFQNNTPIQVGKSANPIKLVGNVTASGNISSSKADGVHTLGGDLTIGRHLTLGSNSTLTMPEGSAITNVSTTHITASGNISSSGTIISNDLQITGSGNIYGSSSYLNIVNDGTAPSELRLNCEANSHYIGIRGPVHSGASSYVLKLPNAAPSDNQILKVNGSPSNGEVTLAWEADADSGGGGGSVAGSDTQVQFNDGGSFGGDAGLVYNKNTDTLTAGAITSTGDFVQSGPGAGNFISASSGTLELSGSGTARLEVDGNISASGDIHAEGNITASGTLKANGNIVGDNLTNISGIMNLTMLGDLDVRGNSSFGNAIGDTVTISGNVTASGDISASGTITSNNLLSHYRTFDSGSTPAGDDYGTAGHSMGDVVYFGSVNTGTMVAGKMYYLNTAAQWVLTDASDNTKGVDELKAIALGDTPTTHGMLLRGIVTLSTSVGTSYRGRAVYMSPTAGELDITAPTGGDEVVQICGYLLASNDVIYFNPSKTWVKIAS